MRAITVLYDGRCALCLRCRKWMEGQPRMLEVEFLAAGSAEAARRFPTLVPPPGGRAEERIVISDEGGVYRAEAAYLMCLYALRGYREWSFRLAHPSRRPLVRQAFAWL